MAVFNSSSHFPLISAWSRNVPVMFPPGLAKEATKPAATGSLSIGSPFGKAIINGEVAVLDVAELAHALTECAQEVRQRAGELIQEADPRDLPLLRLGSERRGEEAQSEDSDECDTSDSHAATVGCWLNTVAIFRQAVDPAQLDLPTGHEAALTKRVPPTSVGGNRASSESTRFDGASEASGRLSFGAHLSPPPFPPRTRDASLNDLVGAEQERLWDRKRKGVRGFEVHHELELGRLLHRKIARPGTS
jgi:hypothetical protein